MKQKRAKSLADLIAAGTAARAGAGTHATDLNLFVGTPSLINGDLLPLIEYRDSHNVAKTELSELRAALRVKTKALYEVLFNARDFLKRTLGKHHSPVWNGTGFDRSLRIPRTIAQLQNVAGSLAAYLEANSSLEVPGILSALIVRSALEESVSAQGAVTLQESVVGGELTKRRQKEKALRRRLSWMVDELRRVLDPLDDRWTAFGFNKPGVQQKPPTPEQVTVTPVGEGAHLVKWEKSARARHYRVWLKIEGEEEASAVSTTSDQDFLLETVPPGKSVEISVSAVNSGGESARSEGTDRSRIEFSVSSVQKTAVAASEAPTTAEGSPASGEET